jgi:hypothetical protein
MATIGELEATGKHKAVYRRPNGQLYIKLNERFHIKTKLSEDGKSWLGDGTVEELDPNEKVEVVQ